MINSKRLQITGDSILDLGGNLSAALREEMYCFEGMEAGHIKTLVEQNRMNATLQVMETGGKQSFCGEFPSPMKPQLPRKEIHFTSLDDQ